MLTIPELTAKTNRPLGKEKGLTPRNRVGCCWSGAGRWGKRGKLVKSILRSVKWIPWDTGFMGGLNKCMGSAWDDIAAA